MTTIRERLRKAVEMEVTRPERMRVSGQAALPPAFSPVRDAALQLRDELKDIRNLHIEIEPDGVRIALYDKELSFAYDPEQRAFVGSESDTVWMDGGQHAESFGWDSAEACIDAMIHATARHVALTRALSALLSA
jgi:hypothetical protein